MKTPANNTRNMNTASPATPTQNPTPATGLKALIENITVEQLQELLNTSAITALVQSPAVKDMLDVVVKMIHESIAVTNDKEPTPQITTDGNKVIVEVEASKLATVPNFNPKDLMSFKKYGFDIDLISRLSNGNMDNVMVILV